LSSAFSGLAGMVFGTWVNVPHVAQGVMRNGCQGAGGSQAGLNTRWLGNERGGNGRELANFHPEINRKFENYLICICKLTRISAGN